MVSTGSASFDGESQSLQLLAVPPAIAMRQSELFRVESGSYLHILTMTRRTEPAEDSSRVFSPAPGSDCGSIECCATSDYMKKWMRNRLKRRKKNEPTGSAEEVGTPAPLQPKFYDNEPGAPEETAAPAEPAKPEPERPPVEATDSEAELASPAMTPEQPDTSRASPRPSRRRRRGRGRRGTGSRSRPSPEAASQPVASDVPASEPTAEAPVAEAEPAPPAASKGAVILAIGLPGSGKSSWFKRHNIRPLSSDLLRELLFDDAQEQRFQDLVFSNLRSLLKARLIARRPVNHVDATNLTAHDRHSWIKLAKDYGYDVQGVFFDVPLEVCLERNRRRDRVVDEDIMRKMAAKLKAPTFDEGFSKITVVRVKQKDRQDEPV